MRVGEVIEYKGKKAVVTKIINVNWSMYESGPSTKCEFIAQYVGTDDHTYNFEKEQPFTKSYSYENVSSFDSKEELFKAGTIRMASDKDQPGSDCCIVITGIKEIKYDFVNLVVTYDAEIIPEWDENEINQAVYADRRSKFTVISNTK
ncbi:hypothetical protein [Lapidilactobacillus gannanensis]|uniref:Uncharacterized protein n=2 Tax=Lapidilactobacillus gannanensis TaxID=2486002 RepID=A0ABW4BKM1_9LACO